jgi:hypothetical protein
MTICVKAPIKAITHNMALMCECASFLVWLTFMIIITTCLFLPKKKTLMAILIKFLCDWWQP